MASEKGMSDIMTELTSPEPLPELPRAQALLVEPVRLI